MSKIDARLDNAAETNRAEKVEAAVAVAYEAPTLVLIDEAKKLLLGHTYTEQYRDWGGYGTTRYPS